MKSAWVLLTSLLHLAACAGQAPLPPKAIELNRAGTEALARGDLETADARFQLALEYHPHFVEALTNLGLVEIQRGNFTRARQLITRAQRLNPDVAQPQHALGVLAEREHRPDVAAQNYTEALRVDPGFAPARAGLARLLFNAGKLEEALLQFRRLSEVAPEEVLGFIGLAETLLRLRRISEAEAVVVEASTRFTDSPELAVLRARTAIRHQNFEQAEQLLGPLAQGRSEVAATSLAWLAVMELARGRAPHAVGAAQRALELDPKEPVATYALALALRELHDPSAFEWLQRADRLAPGNFVVREALRR